MHKLFVLLTMLIFVPACYAQSFVGIDGGIGQHTQQGTYFYPSAGSISGGSGTGFLGSVFFETALSHDFSVGLKVGIDFKNTSSSSYESVYTAIGDSSNSGKHETLLPKEGVLKITLLRFAPYLQYSVLNSDFFVQIGPGISHDLIDRATQSINLVDNTFPNGSRSETLQNGPISNVPSILYSAIVSAGYGFSLGDFVISPIVTYDLPLSNIQSNSNLRISSIYGSVGVKFKL